MICSNSVDARRASESAVARVSDSRNILQRAASYAVSNNDEDGEPAAKSHAHTITDARPEGRSRNSQSKIIAATRQKFIAVTLFCAPLRRRGYSQRVGQHWQALQPQLSDGSAVDRFEIGIAQARLRKPRQETCHCDRDRRAPEDIADAVMRSGAE